MNIDERAKQRQIILDKVMSAIYSALDERLKSCVNCVHWSPDYEKCNKFKARPPAHIIAFGCSEFFSIDEIPF